MSIADQIKEYIEAEGDEFIAEGKEILISHLDRVSASMNVAITTGDQERIDLLNAQALALTELGRVKFVDDGRKMLIGIMNIAIRAGIAALA